MNKVQAIDKKFGLFALTWPIFIEISLQMLMGNVDTLMLSHYSDRAVASVGVANQLLNVIVVMFGFVSMGSGIVVSQYLGAKDRVKASEVAVVALLVNLVFGAILSLLIFLCAPTFLRLMGLPQELMEYGQSFLQIVGGFSFIQALMMTASALVKNHGFAKDAMFVTLGMNVLNVIGNYMVLFGPFDLPVKGVTGVAMSTTFARLAGMIVLCLILYKRVNGELPFRCLLNFPKYALVNILRIGLPSAGETLSYNAAQVVVTYFISQLGTEALTTKVYTQNLMMFIYLLSYSIGQATQIQIGYLVGAGQKETAYHACLRSLKIGIASSLVMAVLFAIFREQLLGIFTTNKEILAMGSLLLLITVILEPGRVFNLVIISGLRGAGDAKFPVYMGILSMWGISTGLSWLLGIHLGWGLLGVWIAFACDEWFRGVFMLWRWRTRKWEKMGLAQTQQAQAEEQAAPAGV